MQTNPITPTIDLEAPGLRHGHLKLPHSHDGSAWGAVMIPITVVVGGPGPTALLTGGNHGDEYEGPVALLELSGTLRPEDVSGRVIIVPMMNHPAFLAAKRTSPIDGGNMNRAFPGAPDGGVTAKIADYFQRTLLPMADVVLDIHSGGKTLDFIPFAAAHMLEDAKLQARCVAAMRAFNAPYSVMLKELDSVGMYDTAAEAMGRVFISTELGGGGSVTAASAATAKRGVRNLLQHTGILQGEPSIGDSVNLDTGARGCFITATSEGLLEMLVDLGDVVDKGQPIARVHDVRRSGTSPVVYCADISGILAGRHFPGLITMGDCLAVIGVPV
jgi:N2-acetyl-L-2,4-diaminobutanoate deacetylase